jgi:hypothetical protein
MAYPAMLGQRNIEVGLIPKAGLIPAHPWKARIAMCCKWLALTMALFAGPASAEPLFDEPLFESSAICRTAIASITGRDPKAIQTTRDAKGEFLLTYARPIDNFVWTYRCRIESNRIIWADEPGRWREGPKDATLFFEIVGAGAQLRIIETHADGSTTNQLFDRGMIQ